MATQRNAAQGATSDCASCIIQRQLHRRVEHKIAKDHQQPSLNQTIALPPTIFPSTSTCFIRRNTALISFLYSGFQLTIKNFSSNRVLKILESLDQRCMEYRLQAEPEGGTPYTVSGHDRSSSRSRLFNYPSI